MSLVLTVVNAFGDYPRGAQITDAEKVAEVLASDFAANVVKTSATTTEAPDAPAPSAQSKPLKG
ncbi:hypothetical protein ISN76_12920 [Dyella halodurans]|uniref:Uncharacterized protein n=1 Tax=Dyella halodurans TaxID=1920171 RepID=A0ABV9C1Q8_9GAMM|nr:hypothetical protein [Dyella halodurans]